MKNLLCHFGAWIDERFPLSKMWKEHMADYYAPKNLNFWYFFGSLALLVFVNQIVTGVFLTMFYTPTAHGAFASVEYIMREVKYGWLIRYMHAVGASAFFVVIYLHMFRGLLYGSYKKPRELLWVIGMVIFLCLMAEAFMGYLLPWGQMSFWGAQVITSLFGAIPKVGPHLLTWIRGDYNVAGATLNRFFALHVVAIPIMLIFLVWMHILALHEVGSNNPDGVEIKKNKGADGKPVDGIRFHPYYTVKDLVGVVVFLILFAAVIFWIPEMKGYFLEHANFVPANPLVTPEHIAPVWYFAPFYAMLRAVPDKLFGVIVMLASIVIIFFLPWLDRSPVKSMRYRGFYSRLALFLFCLSFIILFYLGTVPVTPLRKVMAVLCTWIYFLYFILMPFYTKFEKCKTVPERVTK